MCARTELDRHAKEFYEAMGIQLQTFEEANRILVLLPKVRLPGGLFRIDKTDVLFITDHQYPFSPMDMFWTEIEVVLPDGSIPARRRFDRTLFEPPMASVQLASEQRLEPVR